MFGTRRGRVASCLDDENKRCSREKERRYWTPTTRTGSREATAEYLRQTGPAQERGVTHVAVELPLPHHAHRNCSVEKPVCAQECSDVSCGCIKKMNSASNRPAHIARWFVSSAHAVRSQQAASAAPRRPLQARGPWPAKLAGHGPPFV